MVLYRSYLVDDLGTVRICRSSLFLRTTLKHKLSKETFDFLCKGLHRMMKISGQVRTEFNEFFVARARSTRTGEPASEKHLADLITDNNGDINSPRYHQKFC
mmetsp:Transcript_9284/g.19434  ORF Transcript_9284/g.19434 Transcript_9284/m.19434 type:complete len:102 (+) Transcript_9284:1089-1394(+)